MHTHSRAYLALRTVCGAHTHKTHKKNGREQTVHEHEHTHMGLTRVLGQTLLGALKMMLVDARTTQVA